MLREAVCVSEKDNRKAHFANDGSMSPDLRQGQRAQEVTHSPFTVSLKGIFSVSQSATHC